MRQREFDISRRQVIRGAVAAAASTLGAPSVQAQKDQQTLRFVPQADLKILDPIWTTAYITRNHGYLVYDTLFGTDEQSQVRPQMVDRTSVSPDGLKYTFTLRDGLRWHDQQPVLSEDCVESLKRWGKKDRFGQLLMAHTGKITAINKKSFTIELAERFGPVVEALGKPSSNVPFMMPARIASTSPDEQIKEIVGSGPFKFVRDEWQPGEQAAYVRNPDYIPRDEMPSGSTGGKKVHLIVTRQRLEFNRLQGHPQSDGLVDELGRARTQGAARKRRLELASHVVVGGRRQQSRRALRGLFRRRSTCLVRLAGHPTALTSSSPTGFARPIKRNESNSPTRSSRSLSARCRTCRGANGSQPTAFRRKNVRDVLKFAAPIFWNVKVM